MFFFISTCVIIVEMIHNFWIVGKKKKSTFVSLLFLLAGNVCLCVTTRGAMVHFPHRYNTVTVSSCKTILCCVNSRRFNQTTDLGLIKKIKEKKEIAEFKHSQ